MNINGIWCNAVQNRAQAFGGAPIWLHRFTRTSSIQQCDRPVQFSDATVEWEQSMEFENIHVRLLGAGAAQGVSMTLANTFKAETGGEIIASFGAVGAMQQKLQAGEPCDVIILTETQIASLANSQRVLSDSAAALGSVRTGIAVALGETVPDVSTTARLRTALLMAEGIYFPDPQIATAGAHFVNVLSKLGIKHAVGQRSRTYPGGGAALRAMVTDYGVDIVDGYRQQLIACAQISEINSTPGAVLAGALPKEFELVTVYSVADCGSADSRKTAAALHFSRMLTAPHSRELRAYAGFENRT